jgi:ABC-2 type transport system ATP-binding protein
VAQQSGVDLEATGRENLMLQGHVQGMGGGDLEARVGELLDLLGLTAAKDRVVRGYSGGMKRRLDIGLGLIHRPRVLFLDEPTTGLDPEARAAMWEELERLAQMESLTVLLTTHYLEEADKLADRLAIVSRGRIVAEGTPEALKQTLQGDSVTAELENGRAAEGVEAVRAVAGVLDVTADGQVLRARVENGGRAVPGIISALEAREIAVASVTLSRPSLDDVYLHYTGRDFAADDALEPAA